MVQPIGMPSVLTSPRHLPDRILREEHAPPHNRQYIHAPTRVYDAVAERHPDAAVIIPPRVTAVPSQTTATPRDKHLATIVKHGRISWQRSSGYNRRSLVLESAEFSASFRHLATCAHSRRATVR